MKIPLTEVPLLMAMNGWRTVAGNNSFFDLKPEVRNAVAPAVCIKQPPDVVRRSSLPCTCSHVSYQRRLGLRSAFGTSLWLWSLRCRHFQFITTTLALCHYTINTEWNASLPHFRWNLRATNGSRYYYACVIKFL